MALDEPPQHKAHNYRDEFSAPLPGASTPAIPAGALESTPQSGLESPQEASATVQEALTAKPGKSTDDASRAKAPLGKKLIERGLISPDQLEVALRQQREEKSRQKMLGAILVELGFITESALGEILTESSGSEKLDLRGTMLDSNLIKVVPKDIAVRCKAIPVNVNDGVLRIAIADVYNIMALDQLRRYFPKQYKIVPVYASEAQLLEIIDQYYEYEMSIEGILREIETGISERKEISGEIDSYSSPTVRLVDSLLIDAIKQGSSDIHFEPEDAFLRIRYRIDGVMRQIRSLHKDYWPAIVVRIKIMSNMNIAESRNPQDGRISYNVLGRDVDFRVATQPTIHGENIVIRILDKEKSIVPLEKLGFSEHNSSLLKRLLKRPEGIIIVTGPTGSGKSTTLYSILNYINDIDVNIMTLEDPVEYQMPLIRQSNVREDGASMTFVNGIKSLLRQDPDIIFIGEVRNEETATMALRAAMTGHQVFTSLHTNDAMGAIPRLVDIGIPRHLLSGILIGAMAQRLARCLCIHCKQPHTATPEECRVLGVDPANPPQIYSHNGCEKCGHSGYKGRVAINEILAIDRELDELIATGATRKIMLEYALSHGFVPMAQDGIGKVLAGVIDLEELIGTIDMTERL